MSIWIISRFCKRLLRGIRLKRWVVGFGLFLVGLADGVMLTNVISRYRWTGSSSVYKMVFLVSRDEKKRNVSDKWLAWLFFSSGAKCKTISSFFSG